MFAETTSGDLDRQDQPDGEEGNPADPPFDQPPPRPLTATAEVRARSLLERLPPAAGHIQWRGGDWTRVASGLTTDVLGAHLTGERVVGAYPAADGVARLGVIDIDLHPDGREPGPEEVAANEAYAVRKLRELEALGAVGLLVRGHDAGSYHLSFFVAPVAAERLGRWLRAFVADAGGIHVDTFPSPTGGGNAVRLPGRHHRRPDQWSAAWNGSGWDPWPAPLDRLLALPDNPAGLFPDPGRANSAPPTPPASGRPGDVFNLAVPVADVLTAYGWRVDREDGERIRFTRPGKDGGVSASVKDGTAWVFTSSVPNLPASGDGGKPYTAFALVAHLEYGGDFARAAGELARAGYCSTPSGPATPADPPPDPEWPAPPGEEAFAGLAGDVVRAIEPQSEADPVAVLVQTLVSFGSVIGRGAYYEVEADRHHANEDVVLFGRTGRGRKGTSRGQVQRLFRAVDEAWAADRCQTGLSSGEGLIWAVRDPTERQEKVKERGETARYETVVADPGVPDKRLLVYEPEFASVLKQCERQGNTLSPLVRLAWETGDLRSLTKNSPARATGAHVSVIGHITDEELRRYLTVTESANGFANRFIWVAVRRSKLLPDGGRPDPGLIRNLEARLAAAVGFARGAGHVRRDGQARELWHAVYGRLSEGRPGLAGALLGRAEPHALRLAMIYALMDRSDVIRLGHLASALALWDYAERSVLYLFGDSTGDRVADEVLRLLRAAATGVTRTEVSNFLGRNVPSERLDRALGLLLRHGLARMGRESTGGRPADRWFATRR